MEIHKNIQIRQVDSTLAAGLFIYREFIQIGGGHKWIRGVVCDNANSPVPVYIWQGRSPNLGIATIVLPGWSRGFSFGGTSGIYILITGPTTPVTAGIVFLTVSDEPVTAFSSQGVILNPPALPPITIP
jgi:hypothetical protein